MWRHTYPIIIARRDPVRGLDLAVQAVTELEDSYELLMQATLSSTESIFPAEIYDGNPDFPVHAFGFEPMGVVVAVAPRAQDGDAEGAPIAIGIMDRDEYDAAIGFIETLKRYTKVEAERDGLAGVAADQLHLVGLSALLEYADRQMVGLARPRSDLRRLRKDARAAVRGPGDRDLEGAPEIGDWCFRWARERLRLIGDVRGHRKFGDARMITAPLLAMDMDAGWVRTRETWMRLASSFEATLAEGRDFELDKAQRLLAIQRDELIRDTA